MKKILNCSYSFDNKYAQHAAVSMLSLFKSNSHLDEINVYIIQENLSEGVKSRFKNIANSYNRKLAFLDLKYLAKNLGEVYFPLASYGRIFLADHLKNLNRIIYIDSDTVIDGSLDYLINLDLTDTLIAGVRDTVNPYYLKNIGLPENHPYICCGGVIVLNLELWRQLGVTTEALEVINKYNGAPPHNDQGVLNVVAQNRIGILPLRFNVMPPIFNFTSKQLSSLFNLKDYYSQSEIDEAKKTPTVIHYTEEFFSRPWFKGCTHPLRHRYIDTLSETPWRNFEPAEHELSTNCKIQNWVYSNCPFWVYKLMIRFITLRKML